MKQKCSRVDKFKREDHYCISESEVEQKEDVVKHLTVFNRCCELIHEFEGSQIKYSYSEKTNSLYINVDGKIYIVDLDNSKVISEQYSYIELLEDFMIYEQESGCGLNKLTKDGIVNILKPIYFSIEILFDINRVIVSQKDEEGKIKYGVFESNQGNRCLDVIYDSVSYENGRFTCTLGDETFYFDVDGYEVEKPVALNLSSKDSTNEE